MKSLLSLATASAAVFYGAQEPVENSYIVVFKQGLSANEIAAHKGFVASKNVSIDRHYSISNKFNGYAAHMDKDTVSLLLAKDEVAYVEEDGVAHATDMECNTQTGATWGLVRTSQRNLNLDGRYQYGDDATGNQVTAYVIDTGILTTHVDFASGGSSRAKWGSNHVGDGQNNDGNGHGTHCAGTIGGNTWGMAKDVTLVAVKVLNAGGSGTWAGVIAGVDWSWEAGRHDNTPSVASMSLGGGKTQALNDAVNAAATDPEFPLIVVVAAGNNNQNQNNFSPASAEEALSIAASDNADRKASFSNWGPGVICWAPGVSVTSAWIGSNTATNTISGTSMACPHVTGQVSKYLQKNPSATTAEVKTFIRSSATPDKITNGAIGGTPNLLLFSDCSNLPMNVSTVKLAKRW
jgi:subtilisin family serine protease